MKWQWAALTVLWLSGAVVSGLCVSAVLWAGVTDLVGLGLVCLLGGTSLTQLGLGIAAARRWDDLR